MLILLPLFNAAGEVIVEKTILKDVVYPEETLKVNIKVINNFDIQLNGELYDSPPDFITIIKDNEIVDGLEIPDFNNIKTFNLEIPPKDSATFQYTLQFSDIPDALLNNNYSLGTALVVDSEGKEIYSNDVAIFLKTDKELACNYNYQCEEGENHMNCFQDCLSGALDGYCDGLGDGRCDVDCGTFEDSDCLKKKLSENKIYIVIGLIIIIGLIGFAIWKVTKR